MRKITVMLIGGALSFGFLYAKGSDIVKQFSHLQKRTSHEAMIDIAKQQYKGNDFLTKKETDILASKLKKEVAELKKPQWFLLYFYSSSVPKRSIVHFLRDVAILQENGISVETKQYLLGFPSNFRDFLLRMKGELDGYFSKDRNIYLKTQENFHLKFSPDFFKYYHIRTVPAVALVQCSALIPDPKNCKTYYIAHGDAPLSTFFSKIMDKGDRKFKDWYFHLIANKIHKNNKNNHKIDDK